MKFENLQAIWDTQNEKPVFSMKDARLLLALYQQREHSRRQLFWWEFFPMYAAAAVGLAGAAFVFVAFYMKSLYIKQIARDFPMSAWDYAAFAVAAASLLAMAAILYAERKKQERTQNVFAPSLREELDRGVALIDFKLSLHSTPRILKIHGLLYIAVLLFIWEVGRLNGEPAPSWSIVLTCVLSMVAGSWAGLAAGKKKMEEQLPRRRALESMRASLNEAPV